MNVINKNWNKKAMGGLAVVAVIALFMFAFMFSKPVVTGLVTGNESLNISENVSLMNLSVEAIIIEELTESVEDNAHLNATEIEEIIEEKESSEILLDNISMNVTELNVSDNISLNVSVKNLILKNESINDIINISLENITQENISTENITINYSKENISSPDEIVEDVVINITEVEVKIENITEKVVGRVMINRPVKFVKKIKLTGVKKDLVIGLPKNANKIVVKKIIGGIETDISDKVVVKDKERVRDLDEYNLITGGVVVEVRWNIFDKIIEWITSFVGITGYVISEINETELVIEEEVEEVKIEYEIPGPTAVEEELSNWKKRIVISSEIHYEDILSYMFIKDSNAESVRLYWVKDNGREEVGYDGYDTNDDDLVDYIEWIIPSLSNQTYEVEISIINVQSYPSVGGNWTVMFNTTGTADLEIKAVNGTTWNNINEDNDLKFLELMCGNDVVNTNWVNGSVFVENYSCDYDSEEISKVITPGKHNLEFDFGGNKAYAYNDAGHTSCGSITSNGTHTMTANITEYNSTEFCFNITASNIVFDCAGYEVEGKYSSTYDLTAFNIYNSINVTIKNCIITDFSYGIYFESGSNDGFAINNTIKKENLNESFQGITTEDSHRILIENNTISTIGDGENSYAISIVDSDNTSVNNNKIRDVISKGILLSIDGGTCSGNNISNNEIKDSLHDSISIYSCEYSRVFDNIIRHSAADSLEIGGTSFNITINGNTFFNSSESAIEIVSGNNITIEDNVLNITELYSVILLKGTENGLIYNNTIEGSGEEGIELTEESNNNIIKLNTIRNSTYDAIGIINSHNNSFYNLTLINSQWSGIYLLNSSGNVFVDSNLSNNDLEVGNGDIAMEGVNSSNTTLINVSFNQSDVLFIGSGSGLFNINWYLDVYVNDSNGNLQNANVSSWDITGASIFSLLTGSDGNIVQQNITEYFENSSGKTYNTNYTVNTTKSDYVTNSQGLNITDNTELKITLNKVSNITLLNVTPSSATTLDDLVCNVTIEDIDSGDSLSANYTWYKSGVVNLSGSFTVSNGTANWTTLGNGNTTNGENWTCQITPYDGNSYGTAQNDSVVIDNCGMTLSQSLTLKANMTCTGNGFTIGADDVVLDCDGYTIKYSTNSFNKIGISNSYNNVTIQNCNLVEGGSFGSNKHGISYVTISDNGTISDNNITIIGNSYGITLSASDGNNITNNNIDATGSVSKGIRLKSSSASNNILNNEINSTSYAVSIESSGSGGGNIIENNTINSGNIGLYVLTSRNNNFTNNTINSTSGSLAAIYVNKNSDNNRFEENNIIQAYNAIELNFARVSSWYLPENNVFVNNTLSNIANYHFEMDAPTGATINGTYFIDQPIGKYLIDDDGGTFYFKDSSFGEIRYLEPITGSGDNLSADIKIENNSIYVNSSQTGLNKSANLSFFGPNITIGDGTQRAYKDNSVCSSGICSTVTKTGTNYSYNVTGFTKYSVELNNKPQAQNVTLNSTDSLNRTNGTLTGSFDYYDDDGDSQSDNQTRWYLNNSEKSYGEDDTEDSCWRTCGPSSSDCKLYGNLIDEDWSTYIDVSSCFLSNNTFFINYTVPTGITKGNWSIKYDSRYGDVSGFCYNGSWQDLDFEATSGAETKSKRILDTCINYGSVLELKIIGSDYHDDIYEEKVLWQLDNSTNVDKRFTTKGQNWTFSARTNDGYDWGNWSNSSQLTIENSAPSKVILISPTNNNGSLINRTPTFIWNAATDNDNLLAYNEPPISSDTIRYEINITRDTFTGEPDCSTDSKYATGISATNYTIDVELCVDDVYNWTVRAADGTENGEWSDVWNFTVMSYVSIVFVNSSVDFGSLQITQEKNTTGDDPYPLVVENSGNVVVNLTLHANSSLWSRSYAGLNTIYFQYMADNTSETNSFNWSLSQTSFTNLSSVGINLIKALSYNNSKDTAEIELKVVVPPDEPSGSKVTGLVVTATY